ncbi:hypothetical protein LAC81_04550 [Ensifer adhaerens]|uniref:hypothetical protein n=1 Tax=Ensifer adhaerens TaxID=106592 RepID=UPI001CBBC9D1|nr:hypothetical protein [Ensifer adhaerens]MBZ7921061.1 hypothetical protein [Ensifer adhaerens]UAX93506.1 hypothetical protein LAC78_04545 [Ensifer adhaerens]UAY01143.1 hypothetical protein LAC80_04550 [Ensifer adhaerens]UAY08524.1 hypothetical protein LAC81_04550 [Ensifer adhaerens]
MTRTLAAKLLISLSLAGAAAPSAMAADYIGGAPAQSFYDTGVCSEASVLGFITSRFEYRDANYLHANLSIAEIRNTGQSRQELRDETHLVEREYCRATAVMTDGYQRSLYYVIERPWGFAGVGRSIEFCVGGLDPWYVYGAHCASLQ